MSDLKNNKNKVEIFTDGACRGNPGPGGWGAILRFNGVEKELSGSSAQTTNNKMELTAAIEALKILKRSCIVELTTDSQYVSKGVTLWLPQWKQRGWRTRDKKPVKNLTLWQALDELISKHQITWHWVQGHTGHPENERADQLANAAIDKMEQK